MDKESDIHPHIYTYIKSCQLYFNKNIYAYTDTHTMEYYSAIKRNPAICDTQMDLEGIMLSEISQTEKDKYCMISLIRRIQKKKRNSQKQRTEWWLSEVKAGEQGK